MSDSSELPSVTIPWSVKGVSAEARQAAKDAAQAAGMTIGAWLNLAIRQADQDATLTVAAQKSVKETTNGDETGLAHYLQRLDQKLTDISARLDQVEKTPSSTSLGLQNFESISISGLKQ